MDIHVEKELRKQPDRVLMRKMLRFAQPYWKTIVLSIVLAALLVLALLAQPYLIRIAIDDRISGVYKKMVVLPTDDLTAQRALEDHGLKLEWTAEQNGETYYRINGGVLDPIDSEQHTAWRLAQIVKMDGAHYLLQGWMQEQEDNASQLRETGDQYELRIGDRWIRADLIKDGDWSKFRAIDYRGFLVLGVLFLLVIIVAALLNFWQINMLETTGQRVIYDIREKMFGHLTRMHTGYYDRNPVGRLVTRVAHDVEALNQLYSQVIVNLVKEICTLIGVVIFMLYMSVKLTLITFTVLPILILITFYYRSLIRDAQRYTRLVLSQLNSFLAENLSGIRIIQIFTREEKQLEQFDEMNQEYYRAGMRGTIISSIFNPTIGFLGNVALAVIVWYGGKSVLAGVATFGTVYAFTLYVQQFYKPLMGLADRYTQIQTAMASAERVIELLEEKPAIADPAQPQRLPQPLQGEIVFDHVWFAYDGDNWVLRDVSFRVKPGETIAFVGATGAGKSSIINLITRFYDIQRGTIRIDGIDIRELAVDDLRRHVATIQQDAFIFSGSVIDNIRLNQHNVSDEEIEAIVNRLGMGAFIRRLPQRYQTQLGEQGVALSSGQMQLISFLRAAAFNPDILILDEATAHIDTDTEQLVQAALHEVSAKKTTLIVAHRLSTIQDADRIIVLHKGEIQESGSHRELLRRQGSYYRLYEAQNREQHRSSQPVIKRAISGASSGDVEKTQREKPRQLS